jgi:hypothetical protein
MRNVILHYHLFKNAGTSLDETFRANFKAGEWVTREFPSNPHKNRSELQSWIASEVNARCFSSHTAMLPPPKVEGVNVFPVVFLRHPIDRVASVYEFERKQGADTFGSVLARNSDLSRYVEVRLSEVHDHQCRNFHVHRLAAMYPGNHGSELERAIKAAENLPFVGVVSRFDQSLNTLESALQDFGFKGLTLTSTQKNVSRKIDVAMDEKLAEIRSRMSPEIYQSLVEANRDDIEFFQTIDSKYQ